MEAGSERRTKLTEGNAAFRKATDSAIFANLSKNGQHPLMAVLTCSDSRVVPEKIFNLSIGDAFVVRVAGNTASDPQVLGSLEYAVTHLHVRDLIVLGHTGCGAIKVALEGRDNGNLWSVTKDIERAKLKVPIELDKDPDAIAESNVRLQMRLIEDNSFPVREAVERNQLTIHGAMYDLKTGMVRFLS